MIAIWTAHCTGVNNWSENPCLVSQNRRVEEDASEHCLCWLGNNAFLHLLITHNRGLLCTVSEILNQIKNFQYFFWNIYNTLLLNYAFVLRSFMLCNNYVATTALRAHFFIILLQYCLFHYCGTSVFFQVDGSWGWFLSLYVTLLNMWIDEGFSVCFGSNF